MIRDLRLAARSLSRNPGLTAAAVTCLAIGIAANTTVYTATNAIALHPVPTRHSERLVMLAEIPPRGFDADFDILAPANFLDWRKQTRTIETMAAFTNWEVNITGILEPERVSGYRVTPEFFRILGEQPARGRLFTDEEGREGHATSIILSDPLWQRRFAGDRNIVGRSVQLNGAAYTVVGVMAKDFIFPAGAEIWSPLALNGAEGRDRDGRYVNAIGRLMKNATLKQARIEAVTIAQRLAAEYPEFNGKWGMRVEPADEFYGRHPRPFALAQLAAVAFVLLIACANVANLLLAKATTRSRELAVRVALGAQRWDLVRQLFVESTVIAVLGGAAGALLSLWGVLLFRGILPAELLRFNPGWTRISIDARALAFTIVVSVATALLVGVVPAILASRADPQNALKESARGTTTGRGRLRSALVVGEIALACTLLVGTGLMVRSFRNLLKAELGYRPDHVLTMELTPPATRYKKMADVNAFYARLAERLREIPGVRAVALTNLLPPAYGDAHQAMYLEGQPKPRRGEPVERIRYRVVSREYFEAVGMTRLSGRYFEPSDSVAQHVAVITERMAQRFWPGVDAVGKRFIIYSDTTPTTVIGVVRNVRHNPNVTRDTTEPEFFIPMQPTVSWRTMSVLMRTDGDPVAVAAAAQRAIGSVDPALAAGNVATLERMLGSSLAPQRLTTQMMAVFAMIAVLLAAVGIYGVMSYSVSQRTREIGVRVALGARDVDVVRQVLREAGTLIVVGLAVGLGGGFGMAKALRVLLYETSATDPITFSAVALLLAAVALLGSYLPARRAAIVDPMVALRAEV